MDVMQKLIATIPLVDSNTCKVKFETVTMQFWTAGEVIVTGSMAQKRALLAKRERLNPFKMFVL